MNTIIKEIKFGLVEAKISDVDGAMNWLDGFFGQIGWCLEKDEWKRMSKWEKKKFCQKILD